MDEVVENIYWTGGFDSTLMRSSLQENRIKHIYNQMGIDYKFVVNRSKFM